MGAWGTGILEDDLAADVYGGYMERYDEGQDTGDIQEELLESTSDYVQDIPTFWLGLAQAQWECGCLDGEVLARVERIIATGADPDPKQWLLEEDRAERRSALGRFLQQIQVPREQPRPRTKRRVYVPAYEPGTCLSIVMHKGGFGAAIVLKVDQGRYDACHLIGGLRGVHVERPSMTLFEARDWLYLSHGNFRNKQHLIWCTSKDHEEDIERLGLAVVGQTELRPADPTVDPEEPGVGFSGWGWIENQIRLQHDWDTGVGKRKTGKTVQRP